MTKLQKLVVGGLVVGTVCAVMPIFIIFLPAALILTLIFLAAKFSGEIPQPQPAYVPFEPVTLMEYSPEDEMDEAEDEPELVTSDRL